MNPTSPVQTRIIQALTILYDQSEIEFGQVYRGTDPNDGITGWFYRPFDGGCHYLGSSAAEIEQYAADLKQELIEAELGL